MELLFKFEIWRRTQVSELQDNTREPTLHEKRRTLFEQAEAALQKGSWPAGLPVYIGNSNSLGHELRPTLKTHGERQNLDPTRAIATSIQSSAHSYRQPHDRYASPHTRRTAPYILLPPTGPPDRH